MCSLYEMGLIYSNEAEKIAKRIEDIIKIYGKNPSNIIARRRLLSLKAMRSNCLYTAAHLKNYYSNINNPLYEINEDDFNNELYILFDFARYKENVKEI
jgi:hypothetical protein